MKTRLKIITSSLIYLAHTFSHAGEIWDVKGKKVIIDIEANEKMELNQKFIVLHPKNGKKMGLIEIINKKETKALGILLKGFARVGSPIAPTDSESSSSLFTDFEFSKSEKTQKKDSKKEGNSITATKIEKTQRAPASTEEDFENPLLSFDSSDETQDAHELFKSNNAEGLKQRFPGHWGYGLGITPTQIQASSATSSHSMKGNNFVFRLLYDKPINKIFSLLLGGGNLPLSVSQPDNLLGTANVEANFVSLELNGRISLKQTPMEGLWIGAGLNYFSKSSATSNVVNTDYLNSKIIYQLCLGYNARMDSEYLMFRADYLIHPTYSSNFQKANTSQSVLTAIYFF